MVFLLPAMIVVGLLIRVSDGSPVLFRQERVGVDGKRFRILKFRTMHQGKDGDLKITLSGDKRITRLGSLLRTTKLDELPQLFNVFFGEMSFVGPRPEVPEYVQCYTSDQARVLALRPGITDPASLKYFNENRLLSGQEHPHEYYVDHIMPDKIRINLAYAENASALTDVWVILQTLHRTLPFTRRD